MKQLFILVFCAIFLQAGFLDFIDVNHAKSSYEKKDYKSAIKDYKKIQEKDGATYDLANSYYKNKNYKKALDTYKKVSNPKLRFQKLHNMGNTYAHLGKIDEAIKSYEEALKIKKDKDTKYNLDLLKKMKKKQKNKKKKKNQKKKQKNKNSKGSKNKKQKDKNSGKNQKKDKNEKSSQNKKQSKPNKKSQGEKEKQKQNRDEQQKKQNSQKKKNAAQKKKKIEPISDMEERKYKKMLNQRGINTLMLPLSTKGEKRNEKNPW